MRNRGFTLIELLMVILIIGILFGLITGAITKSVASARKKLAQSNMQTLANAVKTYRHEYRTWPLPGGDANATSGIKKYGGTNLNNSTVVNLLKDTGNPTKINFLGNGDYVWGSGSLSGSIVNPTNIICAFIFEFNLDTDSVSVY